MAADQPAIWTIGHSNRMEALFREWLIAHRIETVADVRIYPRSRYNPQFNSDALSESLRLSGIAYAHLRELGGNRQPRPDSSHTALPAGTFRGYADYMETHAFQQALERLSALAHQRRTAILCAEADPLQCHRSLIADALTATGWQVLHILSGTETALHRFRPECRLENGWPAYKGSQMPLPGLGE